MPGGGRETRRRLMHDRRDPAAVGVFERDALNRGLRTNQAGAIGGPHDRAKAQRAGLPAIGSKVDRRHATPHHSRSWISVARFV